MTLRLLLTLLHVLAMLAGLAPHASAQDDGTSPPAATPVEEAIFSGADLGQVAPLPFDGPRQDALSAFVVKAMAVCPVPGASVAVVQNGEVVYLEGFGTRERDGDNPVTSDTLMRVGSVTKPVTATLAAVLIDDGVIAWDTPAVDLLPDFSLSNPELAAHLTVSDLLSGATGLPRRDLEFIFQSDTYSPEGLIDAVARLPLTARLGERFQYSNQAFALGGYALARAAGAAPDNLLTGYEAAIRHHVLNPLGMERSTFDLDRVLVSGNYAAPHAPDLSGTPQAISLVMENRFTMAVAPAGAMWSTARELGVFLQMLTSEGVAADGERVVSAQHLRHTWQPGVSVPPNPELPAVVNAGLAAYGLGWFVGEFGGQTLISHSGGTFGFSSELAFLPEAGLGIAVLANDPVCGALLSYAAQYRLFELVFDLDPLVETEFGLFAGAIDAQRRLVQLLLGEVDADAARAIEGRFGHPELGEIDVRWRNGALIVDAGEIWSRIVPMRGLPGQPVRYAALDPPLAGAPGWFTFEASGDGRSQPVLTVTPAPGEPPIVYRFLRV